MISSENEGYRLVYDGNSVIMFEKCNHGSTTESPFVIEEFETRLDGEVRIAELKLKYGEEPVFFGEA